MKADTAGQVREWLRDHYREVERTRMNGVPLLNRALAVEAVGFEIYEEFRLGVMLTPWFMNLLLLPLVAGEEEEKEPGAELKCGATHRQVLPGGTFEFIIGHEDGLGPVLSCSLFSPVFEFADQEAFVQTAQVVRERVRVPAENSEQDRDAMDEEALADAQMHDIWAGRLPEAKERQNESKGNRGTAHTVTEKGEEGERRGTPSKFSRRDFLRGLRAASDQEKTL